MTEKVALVIPVHNRRETTLRAIRSLRKIELPGLRPKVFLVDDGSSDGTSDAVKNECSLDLEIIQGDGTLHYAAGTNRGIQRALDWGADYVVTMNDDSVFHGEFLIRSVETARRFPRSIIGSLLLLWDRPNTVFQVDPTWSTVRGGWVFPENLTAFDLPREPFSVECIVGNCVLFPADAIRQVGLMDEANFPNGWGDAQYTVRMKNAGWDLIIEPRSIIWCEPNTYPAPLHRASVRKKFLNLFVDQRHPSNLQRVFKALWYSAPSRVQAIAAFSAYFMRLGLKAVGLIPYAGDAHKDA